MSTEEQPLGPGEPAASADPGAQPQPFAEGPREPPGGCSRPLLIGCALTTVLLGLLLLGLLWKAGDLMPALFRWSLDQFEQQVETRLPADLGEGDRQRLAAAFDLAADSVEDGSADPSALQRLQGLLLKVARADELSRDQVLELIEALEAVAGERSPPAPLAPPPSEGEPSQPMAWSGAAPAPGFAAA